MRISIAALAVFGLLTATAGSPSAHGGNHPLPAPLRPPPGPGDTPTSPGLPAPSPRAPSPVATPRAPAVTGGSAAAPATGSTSVAGNALASTGTGLELGSDRASWTLWWRFHAEPFLRVKEHVYGGRTTTGGEEPYQGEGSNGGLPGPPRPHPGELEERVVPALLRAMERGGHDDVVTGAMIALARIGRAAGRETRETIAAALEPRLADGSQEVAETAAIALGVIGHDRAAPLLASLLRDGPSGRRLSGGGEVPTRTRAFAAYGLGLIAHRSEKPDVRRYAVIQLQQTLAAEDGPRPDVEVACVLALGIVPLEEAGLDPEGASGEAAPREGTLEAQVRDLLEVLDDERRDRQTRAHVPVSLARLVARMRGARAEALRAEVALDLVRRLSPRTKEPREVIQGCVIALGMLGDDDDDVVDERVRKTLLAVPDATSDLLARHLALISAGQVAGRRGEGEPLGRIEVRRHLVKQLVRGNTQSRPWCALALALLGRGVASGGEVPSTEVSRAVLDFLESARTPLDAGGAAIAAGLLGDPAAGGELLVQLDRLRDDEARGHVAQGLGLLPERRAVAPLQEIVARSTYHPILLRDAAIGLALLSDRGALPDLLRMLRESRSLASQASVAAALGRIGDRRAVEPLLAVLEDEDVTALARAFAAVALGQVGDLEDLPWSTVYAVGVVYDAAPPTLYSERGGGLLNLL